MGATGTIDMSQRYLADNHEMPGNVGIRTMSFETKSLHKKRKVVNEGLACDRTLESMPETLTKADQVDYPSDEDSDDEIDFELEIPPLDELVNQFEKDDEQLHSIEKDLQGEKDVAQIKGFELKEEDSILDVAEKKMAILNSNISKTREEWAAELPTMLQQCNEKMKMKASLN